MYGIILRDFPWNDSALFGLVSYNDPLYTYIVAYPKLTILWSCEIFIKLHYILLDKI